MFMVIIMKNIAVCFTEKCCFTENIHSMMFL